MSSGFKLYVNASANTVFGIPPSARQEALSDISNTTPSRSDASASTTSSSDTDAETTNSSHTQQQDFGHIDMPSATTAPCGSPAQSVSPVEPPRPEKATSPTPSPRQTRARSEIDSSTAPNPAPTVVASQPSLDLDQPSGSTTIPSQSGTSRYTTRYCCKRDGCRVSANEIPELRRHTKTTRGVNCVSEKPLVDEEIESVSWMKWLRGETRWTVSKHTYNQKKHLLTKQEQSSHIHGGNTAAASAAPSTDAPTNKRKATEEPEEEDVKEDDEEQAGRRSKRLRKLADGPNVREDVMAVPVAGLPAHGHKRKSRDERKMMCLLRGPANEESLLVALLRNENLASQPSTETTAAATTESRHSHTEHSGSFETSHAPAQDLSPDPALASAPEAAGRPKPVPQPTHKMLLDRLYGGIKQADKVKVPANPDIATSKLSKKASAKLASRHESTKLTRERKVLQQFVQDNQGLMGESEEHRSAVTVKGRAGPAAAMDKRHLETGLFDPAVPNAADLAKPEHARTQSHRLPKPIVEQDEQLRDKIYQDEAVRQLVQGAQQMLDPQYERIAVSNLLDHRRPVVPLQDCVDDASAILRHVQAEEVALATIVPHNRTNNGEVFNQYPRNRTKAQKDQLLASQLEVSRKPEDGDRVPSRKVSKDLLTGRIPCVLIEDANKKLQKTDPDLCNDQAVFLAAQWQIENLQGTINDSELAHREYVTNAQERMLKQRNDTIESLLEQADVREAEIKARDAQIEQLRAQLKEQNSGSKLTPPLSSQDAEEQDEIS